MGGNRHRRRKYRAIVGKRSIDIEIRDTDAIIDGITRTYSAVPVNNSLLSLIVDNRSLSAVVSHERGGHYVVVVDGREFEVELRDEKAILLERFGMTSAGPSGLVEVRAPMPGLVLSLRVEEGQLVKSGDGLVVLEAMKMENELRAAAAGTVKSVYVARGDAVGKNDLLVEIEA